MPQETLFCEIENFLKQILLSVAISKTCKTSKVNVKYYLMYSSIEENDSWNERTGKTSWVFINARQGSNSHSQAQPWNVERSETTSITGALILAIA